jgi:hypothetical protein
LFSIQIYNLVAMLVAISVIDNRQLIKMRIKIIITITIVKPITMVTNFFVQNTAKLVFNGYH